LRGALATRQSLVNRKEPEIAKFIPSVTRDPRFLSVARNDKRIWIPSASRRMRGNDNMNFMTIPLIAFLYLYLLFVFIWLIFSLVALFHMVKYGQINFMTFITTFAYLAGSVIILFLSYEYLSRIDWNTGLTIFQGGAGIFGTNNF